MERRNTENAGDLMASVQDIERHLGDWLRARLPNGLTEFIMFGVKMGWWAVVNWPYRFQHDLAGRLAHRAI